MGLKLALVQAERGHLEAKLAMAYHLARYETVTHNERDLEEAKLARERVFSVVNRLADLRREMFEVLGEVMISYQATPELDAAVRRLYEFKALDVDVSRARSVDAAELERLRASSLEALEQQLQNRWQVS